MVEALPGLAGLYSVYSSTVQSGIAWLNVSWAEGAKQLLLTYWDFYILRLVGTLGVIIYYFHFRIMILIVSSNNSDKLNKISFSKRPWEGRWSGFTMWTWLGGDSALHLIPPDKGGVNSDKNNAHGEQLHCSEYNKTVQAKSSHPLRSKFNSSRIRNYSQFYSTIISLNLFLLFISTSQG